MMERIPEMVACAARNSTYKVAHMVSFFLSEAYYFYSDALLGVRRRERIGDGTLDIDDCIGVRRV